MSMIWSSVSSSISWGGRLGPLHVSRSQRQTVARIMLTVCWLQTAPLCLLQWPLRASAGALEHPRLIVLNSAKVVRVVMQDTWEESGQAAMWRRGDNVFGQSSQT